MAVKQRMRNPHGHPNHQREPAQVQHLPPAGEVHQRARIQISAKAVIAVIAVLVSVCGLCIAKYMAVLELRLKEESLLKEKEMQQKLAEEELKIKQALLLEDKRIAHEEEMRRIDTVSEREAELEKYKLDIEKEKIMNQMKLEKEKEIEMQRIEANTIIKEKELENGHLQELERIHLLSGKELEKEMRVERLKIEQALEEKKIEATKEIYMKSFEAKKVVKKKNYMFGLYSTEEEQVESPLKDGATLRMVQEAMRPQLTQEKNKNKQSGGSHTVDEDL